MSQESYVKKEQTKNQKHYLQQNEKNENHAGSQ